MDSYRVLPSFITVSEAQCPIKLGKKKLGKRQSPYWESFTKCNAIKTAAMIFGPDSLDVYWPRRVSTGADAGAQWQNDQRECIFVFFFFFFLLIFLFSLSLSLSLFVVAVFV